MQALARTRLGWAALAAASFSVLLIARELTPSASGLGTHTQLGLPPCGFLLLFHLPCPACGLTTAFAHLAHGSLRASLTAHPLGLPLFLALLLLTPRALLELVRAAPAPALSLARVAELAALYSAALLLVWLVRLSLG
jgi:Protein of unknown function (DUF2752)